MSQALPRFVAAGEALTDLIRVGPEQWISRVGGSTWNVARAVAAQGVPSAFAGAISRDCFGDALWQASGEAGLDARFLQRVARSPLLAVVAQSAPPQYFFVGDDSADLHFDPAALPEGWRRELQWCHFGGISLARAPLAERLLGLATELHAQGVAISYDPNIRNLMDERYLATFERLCRLARVVKVSDEDLAGLMPGLHAAAAFERARRLNPHASWLHTQGAAGAVLSTPGGRWRAVPPPIEVVDTVGAGDACIGAFVASLVQWPQRAAADHLCHGVAAGAAACRSAGASAPTSAAVSAIASQVRVAALAS